MSNMRYGANPESDLKVAKALMRRLSRASEPVLYRSLILILNTNKETRGLHPNGMFVYPTGLVENSYVGVMLGKLMQLGLIEHDGQGSNAVTRGKQGGYTLTESGQEMVANNFERLTLPEAVINVRRR